MIRDFEPLKREFHKLVQVMKEYTLELVPDPDVDPNVEKMIAHVGHDIECVTYGRPGETAVNVSIECIDCAEVIIDADIEIPEPDKGETT